MCPAHLILHDLSKITCKIQSSCSGTDEDASVLVYQTMENGIQVPLFPTDSGKKQDT
jgi:hypothetical protein